MIDSPVERLRRVAARAAAGEPLGEDGPWLAEGLRFYLEAASQGATLDDALGVSRSAGQEAWWTAEARARRDGIIRDLAAHHYAGLPTNRAATAIAQEARRYLGAGWIRDRHSIVMPAGCEGTIRGYLWQAMKAAERFPVSIRQIASILSSDPENVCSSACNQTVDIHC